MRGSGFLQPSTAEIAYTSKNAWIPSAACRSGGSGQASETTAILMPRAQCGEHGEDVGESFENRGRIDRLAQPDKQIWGWLDARSAQDDAVVRVEIRGAH